MLAALERPETIRKRMQQIFIQSDAAFVCDRSCLHQTQLHCIKSMQGLISERAIPSTRLQGVLLYPQAQAVGVSCVLCLRQYWCAPPPCRRSAKQWYHQTSLHPIMRVATALLQQWLNLRIQKGRHLFPKISFTHKWDSCCSLQTCKQWY